jgi:hypothetical protein
MLPALLISRSMLAANIAQLLYRTYSSQVARQLAQQSLQNSVGSGQHRGGLPFSWGRGRQVMHLPCKQVDVGALPTDSTISLRGE